MNPTERVYKNFESLTAATDIAVEIGGDNDYSTLWREWNDQYKQSFPWLETLEGRLSHYGNWPNRSPLQAKVNFLKVNHCVLMLLQPHGRWVNYYELEMQAPTWMGTTNRRSITDGESFYNSLFWEHVQDNPIPHQEETAFPYGARSAVLLDSEHHLKEFIPYLHTLISRRQIPHQIRLLPQTDIKEYPSVATPVEAPMTAHRRVAVINQHVVSFFSTSGNYGDREALNARAMEWYPRATHIITKEGLPNFFKVLT